jgi:hypothetical protein
MFMNRFDTHIWCMVVVLVHLVMFVQWSGLFFHVQIHDNFVLTVILMLERSKKHISKMFGFTLSTIVNNVSYVHQTHTHSCLCPSVQSNQVLNM